MPIDKRYDAARVERRLKVRLFAVHSGPVDSRHERRAENAYAEQTKHKKRSIGRRERVRREGITASQISQQEEYH